MKKKALLFVFVAALASMTQLLLAQSSGNGNGPGNGNGNGNGGVAILIPDSSVENPNDMGHRAHTNHVIAVRPDKGGGSPSGETPDSIRTAYGLSSTGGSNIIAIVDAYDYPTAANDLDAFSKRFGLPQCAVDGSCFEKVYASGKLPGRNCGWAQEAALDIEWAHAMAPNAKIVLVEADSNSFADLFQGVDVATDYIVKHGGIGQVSLSWGGSEFLGETSYDSRLVPPQTSGAHIVYFAASGDAGGKTIYPGVSPNVVSAGGTRINRNPNGDFVSETAWSGSGGGPSKYESIPSYQSAISGIVGNQRGVPDFSFDADPASGVSVYDTTSCQGMSGWMVFGGTSVSSPSLAGIVNLANHLAATSFDELTMIYRGLGTPVFRDITSGAAGSYSAATGWDFVTGVGSNQGTDGK